MKKRERLLLTTILLISLLFTSFITSAQSDVFNEVDDNGNLRLGNDYIVIVTNQDENAKGRFAIETTGGAPLETGDENKPLVYGRPKPWTSYTTLKVNNENYVFGGSTRRRAGEDANYGEVTAGPEVEDDQIYTSSQIEDIKVEQILSIVKSSTTGLFDTAQIKYRLVNTSNQEKEVGLRIMLDTMLGQNDGAPFRLADNAVTTDNLYLKDELPIFWQAFDSIANPTVTSQGTFKGPGVTAPDKVYFSDWGSLADGDWNFDFNPGEEFVREGEYEIDSAIAIMWEPQILEPNQEVTYVTNYGLGGIKVVPGLLALGVTSPAEFTFDENNQYFPVVAYVENTSEINAENVEVEIELPEQFEARENSVKEIGDIESNDTTQVNWEVGTTGGEVPGKITYTVKVTADNTDSNEVQREITFVGPPVIEANITLDENLRKEKGKILPNPFDLKVKLTNIGGSTLFDAKTELSLPPGLTFSEKEVSKKYLGFLQSGESVDVNWSVKVLNVTGEMPYSINVEGLNEYSDTIRKDLDIPKLEPFVYLDKVEYSENYQTYNIIGENLSELNRMELTLDYDPSAYGINYIFPGDMFVKNDKIVLWEDPITSDGEIQFEETLPDSASSGIIGTIQFSKKNENQLNLEINELTAYDDENNEIDIIFENLKEE
ncbi:MAG: NEW3 domain-containing protein [Halanaerobiales bacterium]